MAKAKSAQFFRKRQAADAGLGEGRHRLAGKDVVAVALLGFRFQRLGAELPAKRHELLLLFRQQEFHCKLLDKAQSISAKSLPYRRVARQCRSEPRPLGSGAAAKTAPLSGCILNWVAPTSLFLSVRLL